MALLRAASSLSQRALGKAIAPGHLQRALPTYWQIHDFRTGSACYSAAAGNLNLIKELRERTGAPIVDCKKSLAAVDWDLELAITDLRKRGLSAASKKSGRTTTEGLLGVVCGPHGASIVEVNCETDFVARNPQFQALVGDVAAAASVLQPPSELAHLKACVSQAVGGGLAK
ncbi:hypothetical protein CYMTET_21640 [Cymbomonas tetramitiformis]|uniref:Elongation factor Ts, mitochondrial n=1 Tax=Cymbomonas tetramitiformis TaxID=36881 RepID=A0AAE0G1Z6_9CHLO|nr:hypothetical protein CYMTET_21640 [Cymbomonas tetramitiformis]